MISHYFTFGTSHMCSYPLPGPGHVSDYWVTVTLPEDYHLTHREVFMRQFTGYYCATPYQFSFEYADNFKPQYFPGGELTEITEGGSE